LWVVFPAIILVAIAYPSLVMLYYNETYIDPVYNITVIGNQWYWTYEYNDFNLLEIFKKHITSVHSKKFLALDTAVHSINEALSLKAKNPEKIRDLLTFTTKRDTAIARQIPTRISVDCNLIIAKDPKFLRLLSTDQCLVIPSKTPIRFLITSSDVIHSWAVPSYGIKMDAVPGRLNQQILSVPLVGTSWGQCSELCGVNHAYMPIEIKVLAFGDFLFYMELRIREVLLPYLHKAYRYRLSYITKFLDHVVQWGRTHHRFPFGFTFEDILHISNHFEMRKQGLPSTEELTKALGCDPDDSKFFTNSGKKQTPNSKWNEIRYPDGGQFQIGLKILGKFRS